MQVFLLKIIGESAHLRLVYVYFPFLDVYSFCILFITSEDEAKK